MATKMTEVRPLVATTLTEGVGGTAIAATNSKEGSLMSLLFITVRLIIYPSPADT